MATQQYSQEYLDEYIGYRLGVVLVLFAVLVVLTVSFRFVARYLAKLLFSSEDAFILAATVTALGVITSCAIQLIQGGAGYHMAAIQMSAPHKLIIYAKNTLAGPPLYLSSIAFAKLSITTLYLRIFVQRWVRYSVFALQVFIVLHLVAGVITSCLQCIPLDKLWNPELPGTCIKSVTFFIWISFPNILTDLVILGIPIPVIVNLHAPRAVKIGLGLTFLVGSIGLVTSIARFAFCFQGLSADRTWVAVTLDIWSVAECCTYIIATSLVSFRPLLPYLNGKTLLSKLKSSFGSKDHSEKPQRSSVPSFHPPPPMKPKTATDDGSKIWRSAAWDRLHLGIGSYSQISGPATVVGQEAADEKNTRSSSDTDIAEKDGHHETGIHVKRDVIVSTSKRQQPPADRN